MTRLTKAQVDALTVLEHGPARSSRQRSQAGVVNFRAVGSLRALDLVRVSGGCVEITAPGTQTLAAERARLRQLPTRYDPKPYSRTPLRPAGAPCQHCVHRPARTHRKFPHLATDYCSAACKENHNKQRERTTARALAESIRVLLGLPCGRGPTFTVPELEAMDRRLRRVLPYGGLAMRRPRMRRSA